MILRNSLWVSAIGLSSAIAAMAQSQPNGRPSFAVASIRVAKNSMNGVRGGCHGIDSVYTPGEAASAPPLGRCVITDGRLSHMVGIAFAVTMQMLKTGPDWIQRGDLRFDVQAEADQPTKTTEKQLLQMLQNLLIDRFDLKYHLEPVTLPGFALTIAKGGPKLHESKSQETDDSFGPHGKPGGGAGEFHAKRYSIRDLTSMLSGFADRGPGVDRTGLTGLYDVDLSWNEKDGPTIETALREQLGLRMESQKVQTSYFVIDSAKKPSGN